MPSSAPPWGPSPPRQTAAPAIVPRRLGQNTETTLLLPRGQELSSAPPRGPELQARDVLRAGGGQLRGPGGRVLSLHRVGRTKGLPGLSSPGSMKSGGPPASRPPLPSLSPLGSVVPTPPRAPKPAPGPVHTWSRCSRPLLARTALSFPSAPLTRFLRSLW